MDYFKLLPKIIYDDFEIRNLFFKYYEVKDIPDEYLTKYIVVDGESLQSISYDIYGDAEYWWIISLVNKIADTIFDFPLNTIILQNIAREKATTNNVLDVALFSQYFDELEIENDLKRNIKIVKAEYLNKILADIIKLYNDNK